MATDRKTIEAHEYAQLFPLHEGEPLWKMSDDIKANGQKEPIVLYHGKILDGRRRALACLRAGVEVSTVTFRGSDEEAFAFVVSKNLYRRHLGEGERTLIAAKVANMPRGNPDLQNGEKTKDIPNRTNGPSCISQEKAAVLMNVSPKSVQRAKTVVESGDPKLVKAVQTGQMSVTAAAKAAKAVDEPILPVDSTGRLIPEQALGAFETAKDIGKCCRFLDTIAQMIEVLATKPGGAGLHCDSMVQTCKKLRKSLWQSRATNVCPYCAGKKKTCKACQGEGWVDATTYDQAPSEMKA